MIIKSEAFNAAVSIITGQSNTKFSVNVPVSDSYSNVHAIVIHNCTAKLVKDLVENGFSLSMCDKGMIVDYYGSFFDWSTVEIKSKEVSNG